MLFIFYQETLGLLTLFEYFKKQSLPTKNDAELPDAVTREVTMQWRTP